MNKPPFHPRASRFVFCAALLGIAAIVYAANAAAQQKSAPIPPAITPAQQKEIDDFFYFISHLPRLANGTTVTIQPSDADPRIERFNAPNVMLYRADVKRDAELLVFFPGTGGNPIRTWPLLEAGANAGYSVIGLMYDNGVSVPNICGPQADPTCADRFREKRIFGDAESKDIDDLPAESVVNRLVKCLEYLEAHHPGDGWGEYLVNGQPNWARIIVAGHSQGGGVAAYIAKKRKVARVVVLSGAWDRVEATKEWAPWITSASATPMDRWYAAYHQKEARADAMKAAYEVLKIPPDHVRVLTLEPDPTNTLPKGADAYHVSMAATGVTPLDAKGLPAYAADWAFLLGAAK